MQLGLLMQLLDVWSTEELWKGNATTGFGSHTDGNTLVLLLVLGWRLTSASHIQYFFNTLKDNWQVKYFFSLNELEMHCLEA